MTTLIITRVPVDMDGLASAVAAQKCYPGSLIVLPHALTDRAYSYLSVNRGLLPLAGSESLASCKLLVGINIRWKDLSKRFVSILDNGGELHLYDHTLPLEDRTEGPIKFMGEAGATTTLLLEEIIRKGYPLTPWESTLMAIGIYEATGNLVSAGTTKKDAAAIAFLWDRGVNAAYIQHLLNRQPSLSQKTILEKLVSRIEFYQVNRLRVVFNWAYLDEYSEGIGELVRRVAHMNNTDVIISLLKTANHIKLIAQAYDEQIDLRELLDFWQVQGHAREVTYNFESTSIYRIRQDLLDILATSAFFPVHARDVASYPVQGIDALSTVSEAVNSLTLNGFSGMPVYEGDRAVGMISREDLDKVQRHLPGDAPVKSFMKKGVICAHPDDSLTRLIQMMGENNLARVLVSDGTADRTAGIVTRSDLLRSLARDFSGTAGSYGSGNVFINSEEYVHPESIEDLTPLINKLLSHRLQRILLLIGQRAQKEESRVYLAGGGVRDLILGRGMSEDLDLVVAPDAIAFARVLNRDLQGVVTEHETFGTASIRAEGLPRIDLVTARKEFYAFPAALPQVEASSLKNDLFRRDFTINTLACSLNLDSFGVLFDHFGGRRDLGTGIIRTLYNLSFVDDPLRILRAARFATRFGFVIEEETLKSIKNALQNRLLEQVSRERLNKEIRLVFQEPDPPGVLKKLEELGLIPVIFPRLRPEPKNWVFLGRVKETLKWAHRREWIEKPDGEILYLGALFYGIKADDARFLATRLHLSREKTELIVFTVESLPGLMEELAGENARPGKVFNILGNLPAEVLLLIRALSPNPRVRNAPGFILDSGRQVRPGVGPVDLKKMGLVPGPLYGEILKDLKEAVLDGRIRTPDEEKDFVLSYLESLKGVS